jgi:hypothetical protein
MGLPVSKTQVATLVGGAAVTYTQFLTRAAYVNAHLSDATWRLLLHKEILVQVLERCWNG